METEINAVVTVTAVVNRADGTKEDLGIIGYKNPEAPENDFGDINIELGE